MPQFTPVDYQPEFDNNYSLVPVDHQPDFGDQPVPKQGQTIPPVNARPMTGQAAMTAAGIPDITRMTPEEQQGFALTSLAGAFVPPAAKGAAKVGETVAEAVAPETKGLLRTVAGYAGQHGAPDMESGSPLHNVTLNGTYPKDFYSGQGFQYYAPGNEGGMDRATFNKITSLKDKPDEMVKIYRAVPWEGRPGYTLNSGGPSGGVINPGDWVSISRDYAKDHGESALNGNYALVTKKVPAKELFTAGDSFHEWGWSPPQPAQSQGIRAYHGSPYDFNQFDLSKIGTGEGAQAYGHGLYFAENPQTAQSYREGLTRTSGDAARDWTSRNPEIAAQARQQLFDASKKLGINLPDDNIFALMLTSAKEGQPPDAFTPEVTKAIQQTWEKPPGRTYEVSINADPEHFLDWDKPLSEQHPKVQEALQSVGAYTGGAPPVTDIKDPQIRSIVRNALNQNEGRAEGIELIIDNDQKLYNAARTHAAKTGRNLDDEDVRASDYVVEQAKPYLDKVHQSQTATGEQFIRGFGDKEQATQQFRNAGIPGIKYLDQGSRDISEQVQSAQKSLDYWKGIGDQDKIAMSERVLANAQKMSQHGTSNYVVFDDKLIDIIKKYGMAGLVAGGAKHFATQQVDHQPDFEESQ